MNFYLAALDDTERQPGDGPSIGLILCRERNRVAVEYALRNVSGPIGVCRIARNPETCHLSHVGPHEIRELACRLSHDCSKYETAVEARCDQRCSVSSSREYGWIPQSQRSMVGPIVALAASVIRAKARPTLPKNAAIAARHTCRFVAGYKTVKPGPTDPEFGSRRGDRVPL
jgi:hypothetical protein